ncbi:hypothetical protein Tco_0706219 [Tanacetum coccineum]|uniref:Uncharacterized protein n=1 Tax=Tanacetum coccineum TaxID=301880 RepID=A0ABQ4Y6R8_9ASTR
MCTENNHQRSREYISYKQSSSTRSTATTRHKGKEIAKPVTPQSESVSEEDVKAKARHDEEIDEQELEAHYSYMAKIQEVSPAESSSTDTPLEQVQNHDENDVFANVRRHSEQPESINDTYVLEKDDSDVIPDSSNIYMEENKTVQKQLKKANASLTQELKECKTNLDESSRATGKQKTLTTMSEMEKQIKFFNENSVINLNQSIQTRGHNIPIYTTDPATDLSPDGKNSPIFQRRVDQNWIKTQ